MRCVCAAPREGDPATRDAVVASDATTLSVLACVVHDLASPLAALTSNLTVASELSAELGGSDAVLELREVIQDVAASTENIRRIVDDLRAFSRTAAETTTPADEAFAIARRLGRASLVRRCDLKLSLPAGMVLPGTPPVVVRAITRLLIAMTSDLGVERGPLRPLAVEGSASEGGDAGLVLQIRRDPFSATTEHAIGAALASWTNARAELAHDGTQAIVRLSIEGSAR